MTLGPLRPVVRLSLTETDVGLESSARNIDMVFSRYTDERTTLVDVAYVPGVGFNLYLLHAIYRAHMAISDESGTHIIGTGLTFHVCATAMVHAYA